MDYTKDDIIKQLLLEEDTENNLIWMYITLLDMGVENCIFEGDRETFRASMRILSDESKIHKQIINDIISRQ